MLNVSLPPCSTNFDILPANFSALTGIKGKRTDCIISFDILITSSSDIPILDAAIIIRGFLTPKSSI